MLKCQYSVCKTWWDSLGSDGVSHCSTFRYLHLIWGLWFDESLFDEIDTEGTDGEDGEADHQRYAQVHPDVDTLSCVDAYKQKERQQLAKR